MHVIIGLPGESKIMTMETVRYLSELEFSKKAELESPDKHDGDVISDEAADSKMKEISKAVCKKIDGIKPVSYTHLDVYKRQKMYFSMMKCVREYVHCGCGLCIIIVHERIIG